MAFVLHLDEHTREILNIIRKALDHLLVFASRSGRSVLQRPVCLTPRSLAPGGTSTSDNHVGTSSCQTMKKRVVDRASGPAKVRLPRLATFGSRQVSRRLNKIGGFQDRGPAVRI